MAATKAHFDDGSIGYIRFGFGLGGENSPTRGVNLTACQQEMTDLGFTTVAPPWPSPSSSEWAASVATVWVEYQHSMLDYLASLGFGNAIVSVSLSPISVSPIDASTPDAVGAIAAGYGFMIGDQGWRQSDASTYASGGTCAGDWCAMFAEERGRAPLELQSVCVSNPAPATGMTGDLGQMFPFAIARGAQVLEIYTADFLCAFDPTYSVSAAGCAGSNPYSACQAAGYPAAFQAAAAVLNP
jgi:hypothetical protein